MNSTKRTIIDYAIFLILGYLTTMIGSLVGLFLGMQIAGNYADEMQFGHMRGYELGGPIGAVLIGTLIGSLTVWELAKRRNRTPFWHIFGGFLLGGAIMLLFMSAGYFELSTWYPLLPLLLGMAMVARQDIIHPDLKALDDRKGRKTF